MKSFQGGAKLPGRVASHAFSKIEAAILERGRKYHTHRGQRSEVRGWARGDSFQPEQNALKSGMGATSFKCIFKLFIVHKQTSEATVKSKPHRN